MDEVSLVEGRAQENLVLVLNSGSSSLKFGVYFRGTNDDDEVALLTGSAEGIGHNNGSLHIRSSDGKSLLTRECIHESQSQALDVLAKAIREHIHTSPVAVGHRVVHGGPKLVRHQLITEKVLEELRLATHFTPLFIRRFLRSRRGSRFPKAISKPAFDAMDSTEFPTNRWCTTLAQTSPN